MKKTISAICVAALVLGTTSATIATAQAAPLQTYHQTYHQQPQPRFERHGSYAYYNGHKGYKTRHVGYRYYDGYWFPPAAFVVAGIFGAIVGGIIANQH